MRSDQPENWLQRLRRGAIGLGIITCLVLATFLGISVTYLFPDAAGEEGSLQSNLIGSAILAVSIAAGIWEAYQHRSRS